jgi:hypothetical protein
MSNTRTELASISVTRGTIHVAAKRDTTLEIASIASESTSTTIQCMRGPPLVTRETHIGVPLGTVSHFGRRIDVIGTTIASVPMIAVEDAFTIINQISAGML